MRRFDVLLTVVETRISRDIAPQRDTLPSLMQTLADLVAPPSEGR